MAGAILNPFAEIGDHCIVNTGAFVDHDVKIGDFVHVTHHCTLCGAVEVGAGKDCFIGAGSVVEKTFRMVAYAMATRQGL